jgi:hypothetical protein
VFWCTVCGIKLSEKSWKRHEESQHFLQQEWTCMPSGLPFTDAHNLTDSECVFCRNTIPVGLRNAHVLSCSRRAFECSTHPKQDRTFSRKDHLKQHMKAFHGTTVKNDELNTWCSNKIQGQIGWTCGFCGDNLSDWATRAAHIARHFRNGCTMTSWDLSRGRRTDQVLDMSEFSQAPPLNQMSVSARRTAPQPHELANNSLTSSDTEAIKCRTDDSPIRVIPPGFDSDNEALDSWNDWDSSLLTNTLDNKPDYSWLG